MNLLADESVDGPIVRALRQAGHDVVYVAELDPGIDDPQVLDHAANAGAVLLTADKDFGELVFRQGRAASGVSLLRFSGLGLDTKARLTAQAIAEHGHEMQRRFSVVSPFRVRIRRPS